MLTVHRCAGSEDGDDVFRPSEGEEEEVEESSEDDVRAAALFCP